MVNSRCYASPLLSSSFTILVDVPIGILAQPESLVSCTGQEAQFVVSVYGSEPTYQWMKDGEPIDGNVTAQTNHLVLTGLDADDAGTYALRVGSRCSDISILSHAAMLTVLPLPAFVELPAGARVCERGSVALQARASGVDVRYQWIHDGQEVEGATDSVLYLYDVTPAAGGTYAVRVSDVCASLESEGVEVTVVSPVRIIDQPHAVTVCEQHTVLLAVNAIGSTGIYEWFKDGVPVVGAVTPELRIESALLSDAGWYSCRLSGAMECQPSELMSEPARVIVLSAPVIASQTRVAYAALHGQAVMRVVVNAASEADIHRSYQWFVDGAALTDDQRFFGTSTAKLTVLDIGVHDAQRVYICRVNGMCGEVRSEPVRFVIPPVTILQEPRDAKICSGSSAQVSIVAVTDEGIPLSYQWLRNGTAVRGATSATLSMPVFTDADNGEYIVRMNLGDDVYVTSRGAQLLALHAPRFVDPEEYHSIRLCPGTYFGLNAGIAAGNDLKYQWYLNAVPLEGAVDKTYVEYAVVNTSAGQYSVKVYNDCATIEHTMANLSVLPETQITRQPMPRLIVREGGVIRLTVEAQGDRVQYQWEREGDVIPGATNSVFTKVAGPDDAGTYKARVASTCGLVVSEPSLVMVNAVSVSGDEENPGWSVGPCSPQPVSERCVIPVALAVSAQVRISLVDMFGREVFLLRDESMEAGSYAVVFDAGERGLASGRYTVVVTSSLGHRLTAPLMIVR
ncbi:MAG: immunoglobulin domain-containing protein, partial [Candidatus Kapaibacterium sp.]